LGAAPERCDINEEEIPMSQMTEKMSESSNKVATERGVGNPKMGERFRCETCGMEIEVTADCGCKDPNMVHFHCCGKELQKV
jgi:hypothetical protein